MPTKVDERALTAEEFAHMPESRGAELVRGKTVWPGVAEEPVNNGLHGCIVARLGALLLGFCFHGGSVRSSPATPE